MCVCFKNLNLILKFFYLAAFNQVLMRILRDRLLILLVNFSFKKLSTIQPKALDLDKHI